MSFYDKFLIVVLYIMLHAQAVMAYHRGNSFLFAVVIVTLIVIDGIPLLAISFDKLQRRKCRREGHEWGMLVGDTPGDPTPAYKRCTRCGEEQPVE